MSCHHVILLLGSNLGDTEKNILTAVRLLEGGVGEVVAQTPMIEIPPVEFVSNYIFRNIALLIKTQFSPIKLLNFIKDIEVSMGRRFDTKSTGVYSDRIIDIDIVMFGNLQFWCSRLELPHQKHLYHRDFSKKLLGKLPKY